MTIILYGASGRLGSAIAQTLRDHHVKFVPRGRSLPKASPPPGEKLVIVDALPGGTLLQYAEEIADLKVSGVILASTGWEPSDSSKVQSMLAHLPVLLAPNLSFGIRWLAKAIASLPPPDEATLLDIHHAQKRDAPSGTAVLLADLCEKHWSIRPFITSKREGEVPGTHIIVWKRGAEVLKLEHQAMSRAAFAAGVLELSDWVIAQPKGWYSLWQM